MIYFSLDVGDCFHDLHHKGASTTTTGSAASLSSAGFVSRTTSSGSSGSLSATGMASSSFRHYILPSQKNIKTRIFK